MTSKNLFFKLMREDWKNRLWAPALIALASFFAYPVFLAFMAGSLPLVLGTVHKMDLF